MAGAGEIVLQRNDEEDLEIGDGGGNVTSARRSPAVASSPGRVRRFLPADMFVPIFSPPIPPSFAFRRPELWISSESDSDSASDRGEDASETDPLGGGPAHCDGRGEMIPLNGSFDLPSLHVSDTAEGSVESGLEPGIMIGEEDEQHDKDDTVLVCCSSAESTSSGGEGKLSTSTSSQGSEMMGSRSRRDADSEEEDDAILMIRRHFDGLLEPDRVRDDLEGPVCWDYPESFDEHQSNPDEDDGGEEIDVRIDEMDLTAYLDYLHSVPVDLANLNLEIFMSEDEFDGEIPDEREAGDSFAGEDQVNFTAGNPPAARSVIKHLPSISLTEIDGAENNLCAICKAEISVEEKVTQLPCFHHYHSECILPWLMIRNTCPLCRFELLADDFSR